MDAPTQISITAPGEGAIIAGFNLLAKIIDGQTPEQKKIICEQWLAFMSPWNALATEVSKDAAGFITAIIGKLNRGGA